MPSTTDCESVEERKKSGKTGNRTLTLEAYHESNHIVIEVTDDGRGIDSNQIKKQSPGKEFYEQGRA